VIPRLHKEVDFIEEMECRERSEATRANSLTFVSIVELDVKQATRTRCEKSLDSFE
jgi:hypothetical protein